MAASGDSSSSACRRAWPVASGDVPHSERRQTRSSGITERRDRGTPDFARRISVRAAASMQGPTWRSASLALTARKPVLLAKGDRSGHHVVDDAHRTAPASIGSAIDPAVADARAGDYCRRSKTPLPKRSVQNAPGVCGMTSAHVMLPSGWRVER